MGKTSARGSFLLFVGQITSTVILAIGTILLQVVISEQAYGLYAISLIPATTILLFQELGVGPALVRHCAKCKSVNNVSATREAIIAGLSFEVATGLALTILSLLLANLTASVIGRPESAFLIAVASVIILFTALLTTSKSTFIGFERMDLYVVVVTCQTATQCAISLLLVSQGYGALGALLGYISGCIAGGATSIGLLYFKILRRLKNTGKERDSLFRTLRPLLTFGFPLAVGSILAGLLAQFYSFTMAIFVKDAAIIGNYKTATNFATLLAFFSTPISTVLFPAFSKIDPKNEKEILRTVFKSAVKYTAMLIVPATLAMMVLSQTLISTIYGGKWLIAPYFLTLYVTINILTIFGNLAAFSLLTAAGKTRLLVRLYALSLFIGIPLALFIVPTFGIPGLILVNIVGGLPSMSIAVYWVWRHYEVVLDFRESIKILSSAVMSAGLTYFALSIITTSEWIRLALGVITFVSAYLILAPAIGAINQDDTNNLRAMFSNLWVLSKLIEIPLVMVETVLQKKWQKPDIRKNDTPT